MIDPRETGKKFKIQTYGYLLAAFGLVVGLAWNDAVKALIESVFPSSSDGILAKFIYALLVTLLVFFLGSILKPDEE